MRAIGLAKVVDTDNLIGGQISIKLTIKQDPKYGASNEVKGFRSVSGSAAPAASVIPAKTLTPAPAKTPFGAPWKKK